MKELSVFVDESGDFGEYEKHAPYYIITMILHDQSVDISAEISKLNEALKNFNNTLDNSINTNLKIKSKKENIITDSKNLYKIILTCGEFEEPYIDEHNIEIVINNEKKLMSLIKKYDKINEEYFQNKLVFKTFNLDDKKYIQELIKVLKNSIEHN